MPLSFKQLQSFISLAECQSFALAADKLCVSQPALSSTIKKCEEVLGGQLFHRTTRNVSLTKEGEWFYPKALRFYQEYIGLNNHVKEMFAKEQGMLHLACIPSFAQGGLAHHMRDFIGMYPNIHFHIQDVIVEQAISAVQNEKVEIAFTFEPANHSDIIFLPLFNDGFMVVMPPHHAFANQSQISLRELHDTPFIAMNHQASLRTYIDEAAANVEMTFNQVAEASQIATIGHLIQANIGISILPELARQHMQELGLVCVSLPKREIQRQLGMVKSRHTALSVLAQAFWEFMQKRASTTWSL
jgi:LysR family carnitine catabolism transcriptional activator